jgi:O-antigen biosynthesis protein WbqV
MERVAVRAQTVVFDVLLAAVAFSLAFFVAPTQPELGFGQAGALGFVQLAAL